MVRVGGFYLPHTHRRARSSGSSSGGAQPVEGEHWDGPAQAGLFLEGKSRKYLVLLSQCCQADRGDAGGRWGHLGYWTGVFGIVGVLGMLGVLGVWGILGILGMLHHTLICQREEPRG